MPRGSGMQRYWQRIKALMHTYNLTTRQAREFYRHGMFRDVEQEGFDRFQKRYKVRYEDDTPHFFRIDRSREVEVQAASLQRAVSRSFYDAMVRRLQVWTGLDRSEVRSYLARYENWRDGISPLFHGEE